MSSVRGLLLAPLLPCDVTEGCAHGFCVLSGPKTVSLANVNLAWQMPCSETCTSMPGAVVQAKFNQAYLLVQQPKKTSVDVQLQLKCEVKDCLAGQ